MSRPFYLTTTLPYVNADPHIGFAFELVSADIIARYRRNMGDEVFFNTGTDEHGLKIYRKAQEEGKEPQPYVDEYAEKYHALIAALGVSPDIHFIRTTDSGHKKAAQKLWERCAAAGDMYKKQYKIKYCVGCELEKTESELQNGHCSVHPNLPLEIIEEENYFFRLSKYQERLLAFYEQRKDFVVPSFRLNEIRSLIRENGLEDFSISRLKTKMPWGVPVPDDEEHIMYVWFDALVSYISTLGWPDNEASFRKWWIDTGGVVQFAGKDQIRQQAVMWQAMLMSAGLPPSRQIVIHGFITSEGEKMSKSLGNVIDPFALVKEYGTDAVRFYLARHIHPFEDSDFTLAKFKEAYNADLANGIGNLVSRLMKMAQEHAVFLPSSVEEGNERGGGAFSGREDFPEDYKKAFAEYNIQAAAEYVIREVTALDRRIQETAPFKLVKTDKGAGQKILSELIAELSRVAHLLEPIIPAAAAKIQDVIAKNRMPAEPLFPRK